MPPLRKKTRSVPSSWRASSTTPGCSITAMKSAEWSSAVQYEPGSWGLRVWCVHL